jgi:hypothetical protein
VAGFFAFELAKKSDQRHFGLMDLVFGLSFERYSALDVLVNFLSPPREEQPKRLPCCSAVSGLYERLRMD